MINTWLSKKKGSTFFNLMTMPDIAYTVAALENSYEVWDQEYNKKKTSRTDWELYMGSEKYTIKTKIHRSKGQEERILWFGME
jgi:hypothetical protein